MSSKMQFDEAYYLSLYADVRAAVSAKIITAKEHWEKYGWKEERNPNADFDTAYYAAANWDVVAAGVNYLDHFLTNGSKEGRYPSAAWAGIDLTKFDKNAYLDANPDVKAANVDALQHYMLYGKFEARTGAKLQDGTNITPPSSGSGVGQTFTLTASTTDAAIANLFIAPDFFNAPSGTYLQTLNTGDRLTGTGTNPTLNATLTALTATPTMNGVETLNLTANANATLSLAASSGVKNINSVDSLATPTVNGLSNALTSVGLTRTNASLSITHADAALAGTSDAITLNLNAAGSSVAQPTVTLQSTTASSGYETINIVTSGAASRLASLTDGVSTSLATINVKGDKALRIDGVLDATVKTLDATGMTAGGSVRATLAALAGGHDVKGSLGDDRITVRDLNANDKIALGAGTADMLIAVDTSNTNTIAGLDTNITGVETLGVVSGTGGGNTVTFDSTKVTGITGVTLTNGDAVADNFAATINNEVLTSKSGTGVTLTTPSTAGTAFGTIGITVKGADLAGTDHLTVNIGTDTASNATAFNTGVLTVNSIETLTLNVGDAAAHTVGGLVGNVLGTLNITGGTANTAFEITGSSVASTVNASAFKGDLALAGFAAGIAPTQYVTLGAGSDTFTFSSGTPGAAVAAANPVNIVTGGTGNDTFNLLQASQTFSTAGFAAPTTPIKASDFDRIVDFNFGGVSTSATTNSDYFTYDDGAAGAVARGSVTITNDGAVTALSTTTYANLDAALLAVVGGTSVSKAGGGTATGVENGGANTTAIAGLYSYDGAIFLVGELGSGGASAAYSDANNFIVALSGVTGTLDAWDLRII